MADLHRLSSDFQASQQFSREGETRSEASTRRGIEAGMLENADVVIDLGGEAGSSQRYVAMANYNDIEDIHIRPMDSDLVDMALCNDNVHSLAELNFGQGNQFAPMYEAFVDKVQLSDLPKDVSSNVSAKLSELNPEAEVVAEDVQRNMSGVCNGPGGMGQGQ